MHAGPEGAAVEMNSAARHRRHAALRYGRLVTWLVSGALLIAFANYVALPFGLASYIPQLAAQYGIRLDLERVRVEPFRSRLRLSGVRIATSGDSSMEWSNIETRVDLAELLSGRLVLDGFRLSEAKLHAGDPRKGVAGMLPEAPSALPEKVSVGELVIDGVELAAISEALGHPVAIDWLRISSLDEVFRPGGAEVEADISIGQGRSRLRGQLTLDETGWILDAEFVANDIPLDGFPVLLGAEGAGRGRLDGAGPVRLVHSPVNGAFSATTGGRWAIDGLELGLAQVAISGGRADWDGAAFMMLSGDTVDAFSVEGEIGLRELQVDVVDVLEVEAAELVLRIDASQAPETRLSVEGYIPVARFNGKGGAFEAVGAEATNLVSQVALTFADGIGVEVDLLKSNALAVKLPADRSIDVEQLELERVVVESGKNVISAATVTAERVDWRGLTDQRSAGTATRLAMQRVDWHENGELQLALASTETLEDRKGDSVLRLRDVVLDSTTFSPAGTVAVGGVRMSDAWLASETNTLILERLSLDGVEQDEAGVVSIASGRAQVVDHTHTGSSAIVGTGFEVVGVTVASAAWEAKYILLDALDIETGDASYALGEVALVDAMGEGERGNARLARLRALEHDSGGNRVVVEDLSVDYPAWREGAGDAQAIEAVSVTVDTLDPHRWQLSGWRLTGVERAASGRASAETTSLENLVLSVADGSTAGAQRIELDGLIFDGESAVHAASAFAERTYYRANDGSGIDVTSLRADAVEWNGETLAAEQGTAPLMSVAAPPVRASFDTVAFTSARFGAGGMREFGTVTSASGRGKVERVLEWSAGALALAGYHTPPFGETMLDFVETRDVEIVGGPGEARLRADRAEARGTRIDASGATVFENAEVEGITLDDTRGAASTSARALRASPLTIRESALEIGALSLSGIESAIGLSERGDWELPALPIGTGEARPAFRVRVQEASTADPGSVIRIVDRTTEPDFAAGVDIASAALRGFDSEAIGVPARFSVEATGGVFTALQADGVLTPGLTGTDLDLNAMIHGLSLRELSPYSRLHLGRSVEGGHADVTLDATIRTSDLEGVADFTLSEVVLGESELPAGSSGLGAVGTSMLHEALDSLEAEQGRIELKAPLRGKLDDPGFDFDGLVIQSLANAALEAAGALPKAE